MNSNIKFKKSELVNKDGKLTLLGSYVVIFVTLSSLNVAFKVLNEMFLDDDVPACH